MSNFSRFRLPLVIATLALVAACSRADNNADSSLAADSTLNRDLMLAGTDTAAQPQLTDVPATPAGSATKSPATKTKTTATKSPGTKSTSTKTKSGNTVTKAPSSAGAGARVGSIAAGTSLALRSDSEVCTNTNKIGDKFTASLSEGVTGSNGAAIPAGATVTLTVTKLERSNNMNDPIRMEFAVNSISFGGKSYALDANVSSAAVDRVRNQPKSADAKKVIGGAAVGAIAGQILGKNTKSTVIGAAAGAAAGAGVAAATSNYEGCVRAGGNIVVTLSQAVQVTV